MAFFLLLTAALSLGEPPTLPDVDDVPGESPPPAKPDAPAEPDDLESPAPDEGPGSGEEAPTDIEAPSEEPPGEMEPPADEPPSDVTAPSDDPPSDVASPTDEPPSEDPGADEPTVDGPTAGDDIEAPAGGATPPSDAPPPVQRPSTPPDSPGGAEGTKSPPPPRPTAKKPTDAKAPDEPKAKSEGDDEDDENERSGFEDDKPPYKRFKFLRIAVSPKIGYTNGTSRKNGIFDKDKTIESVMMGGMEPVGGGDLGTQRYGGGMGGGEIDFEVFGINAWLDLQKFFKPGGMLAVMVGYDHEFWFHERVRLDLGLGFGFMRVFLGGPLEDLYYDENNPEAVNIATAGIAGRLMTNLHIRLWGPFYTGPQFMLGYHYLWSANVEEVTKERGLHYSPAWNFRVEFVLPPDGTLKGKKKGGS